MTFTATASETITTDKFDANANAVEYGQANIQLIFAAGVFVGSTTAVGIFSNQNGSTLINNGNIFGGGAAGVSFGGDNASITNNAGHNIAGLNNGVNMDGVGSVFTNHGTVSGYRFGGFGFGPDADDVVLNNDGTIYGLGSGVSTLSDFDGGIFNNSGMIHSEEEGVFVSTNPGLTTVINNMAGGTIRGDPAIFSELGRISLDNRGTVSGDIDLNASVGNVNDTVINTGKIKGDVFLGLGNDTFNGNGGNAVEVFGEGGNDTLIGSKKNDTLDGGNSDDVIRGGRGKDKLFGGDDSDSFDFNSVNDSVRGSKRDKIMDFVRGPDEIDLKNIDAKTGVGGNNKFKWIGKNDFHDQKGELRYEDKGSKVIVQGDVNGDGNADLEILVKVGNLGSHDFVL